MNEMKEIKEINEINEIKIPEGIDRISVKQHDDKIVFELIPEKPKFKAGDKVRIKSGISSETHGDGDVTPVFTSTMDGFIGKELTVKEYSFGRCVIFLEDRIEFNFHENWLEPWNGELKKGDLAIFWDKDKGFALIKLYDRKDSGYHYDSSGINWGNAIKFESKEQFEKVLRGEI